jgi:hypothetical protein
LHEEEQHIDIREKLMNLPKVRAKEDFMNALQRKINLADAGLNQKKISEEVKESIWVRLFGKKRNPWLIPSLSLTIVVIFIVSIYVLNTGKFEVVPTMSDFQKKETPSGIVPDSKTLKEDTRTKNSEQDIADNVVTGESKKDKEKTTADFEKEIINPSPKISPSIQPPAEMERLKLSEPVKKEDGRDETGKSEYKKVEKNYSKEIEQNVNEETIVPAETNVKGDEVNQKLKSEDKKENKDAIESKGLIEKKEKNAMKRAVKTATDSTKIDKKVLEKIKEEIQKEK